MPRPKKYAPIQIALHWLVAGLILAAYLASDGMGAALRQRLDTGQAGTPWHVWLGITAFLCILLRVATRAVRGAPRSLPGTWPLAERVATWGHFLLYLLMVATPIPGILAWFGRVGDAGTLHAFLGQALILLALAHSIIAILHHVLFRDETLTRMLPMLKRRGN